MVLKHWVKEKPVLGICNGAQILGEIGLVPGVFITNEILNLTVNGLI